MRICTFDCTKKIPETLTLCFLYSLTYHFFTVLYICEVLFFQVRWFQLSTSPLNFTYPPSYWSLMLFWRYILLYALNPIIMSLFMDYLYYCIYHPFVVHGYDKSCIFRSAKSKSSVCYSSFTVLHYYHPLQYYYLCKVDVYTHYIIYIFV